MILSSWSQAEIDRVERDVQAGRIDEARSRLRWLDTLHLGGTEAAFWRGAIQQADRQFDEALATWAAIPADSPRHLDAVLRRAQLALERGRFAEVEAALEPVDFGANRAQRALRERALQHIYFFTGRSDDLRRRKHEEWASPAHEPQVLRTHWQIDEPKAAPLRTIAARLEAAGKLAPQDDRVWLGQAVLATRTARFDEADGWFRRCLERRPDDPVVWRARLEWAMAADRPSEAVEALRHIPGDRVDPDRRLEIRAWLAARSGDARTEENALNRALERVPGDTRVLARLAELAALDGRSDRVAELRRRKTEADRAADAYRRFLFTRVPADGFDELGRLAETLGRWFEARGWWTLALETGGKSDAARVRAALERLDGVDRRLAQLDRQDAPAPGSTLADAMADLVRDRRVAGRDRAAQPDRWVVPTFRDAAESAGLRHVYDYDPTPLWRMPEMMGGGVGLIDYDGDGWLDVYAVQGGKLPNESDPPPSPQRDRLFRNRGDGTFEEGTKAAGLLAFPGGYGHGATVGDYDNDGHPDLFLTRWRSYALYRNRGDGTFEDATKAAGLAGKRDWPTSAAFADLDGDGDLDLYVCHYSTWDPVTSKPCVDPGHPGKYVSCGPLEYAATPDHVFRNDGGRFVDVSESSGVRAADRDGRGLGVVAAHLDDDDLIDLFVANDRTANLFFRNLGGLRFEEIAAESGVATNAEGRFLAGMGIACGDFDGDHRLDLAVANFYGESTTYYRNLGSGQFADQTAAIGLAAPSRYLLGFGTTFLDADNDGYLDLATANGHVNDLRPNVPFAMPAQLLLGGPSGRLVDVSAHAGACWSIPRLGRGLARGDIDNDGRDDLLIVSEGSPLAFFHNTGPAGHDVVLELRGDSPRSNRDAVGARVVVTAGGRTQFGERFGGGSFLSAADPRLHFGLGNAARVDSVEVKWPSGRVDRYNDLAADTGYLLREGQPRASALRGWKSPPTPSAAAPQVKSGRPSQNPSSGL
ncbi:MAG: FG-GAP-like repeat-containing protein [Isosphaeraceae bacterium]